MGSKAAAIGMAVARTFREVCAISEATVAAGTCVYIGTSELLDGYFMGCWIIERWRCLLHGHRDLSRTPSYAAALPGGNIRELHERRQAKEATQLKWEDLQV
jgi:hypothetical protein